ncbi:MAG: hypothetical protein ACTHX2_07400 [Microbacterium sp.]
MREDRTGPLEARLGPRTGDFLESAEGIPSWETVLDGLHLHCELLVDDLPVLVAEAAATETETVLWRG